MGFVGLILFTRISDSNSSQPSKRNVTITIDTSYRQELFDQLRKFADQHGFTILIDAQPSGPEDFLIYMTRKDVVISGANVFAPEEYRLGFYDADRREPTPDVVFDALVSDLRDFLSEIPNAVFVEEY